MISECKWNNVRYAVRSRWSTAIYTVWCHELTPAGRAALAPLFLAEYAAPELALFPSDCVTFGVIPHLPEEALL